MEKATPVFDALETLGKEHQETLSQLKALEEELGVLAKKKQALNSMALQLIEKKVRALEIDLGSHFRKEEKILFPHLAAIIGSEGGPIGVMLREHEDLQRDLFTLKGAIETFHVEPNWATLGEVRHAGYGLIDLLRLHISKEDTCLFPLARQLVEKTRLVTLGKEMLAIDREPSNELG